MSDLLTILKPCPFCGGDAAFRTVSVDHAPHYVKCINPGCPVKADSLIAATKAEAAQAWNTRQRARP